MFKRQKPTPSAAREEADEALLTEWLAESARSLAGAGQDYANAFALMISEEKAARSEDATSDTPGSAALRRPWDDFELVPLKVVALAVAGLQENYGPQAAMRCAVKGVQLATRWEDYLIAIGEHPRRQA